MQDDGDAVVNPPTNRCKQGSCRVRERPGTKRELDLYTMHQENIQERRDDRAVVIFMRAHAGSNAQKWRKKRRVDRISLGWLGWAPGCLQGYNALCAF